MAIDLAARLQAVLGSDYVVGRELGGGGMSRVFVASERALGRELVVKVLPPELAGSVSVERFRREIQLAARLQHPHIVPLLSAGHDAELLYYTMPCIQGESLRALLIRERQLPLDQALRIACEVADALDYAHRHGVVHRDVKPENVLLEDGHAVVTDFGIARALAQAADEDSLTGTGVTLGTPAYMSPEQLDAESRIDGRSDIYSLGCVLYEMLAGVPPFAGPNARAVIAKRFTDTVPSVSRARPSVSPALGSIVARALEPVPADRFQTAGEFLEAASTVRLPKSVEAGRPSARGGRRWPSYSSADPRTVSRRVLTTVAGALLLILIGAVGLSAHRVRSRSAPSEPRIAVLPFQNLGPVEDRYFADGITDEMTARLARLREIRVISTTSALQYRESRKSLRQIGSELDVDYVLAGSIRWQRSGEAPARVRVTPRLVRISDDAQLWAHVYDEIMTEVFDVQSDIAEQVARALGVALTDAEADAAGVPPTNDLEAYHTYLRAIDYYYRGYAEQSTRTAQQLFQQAVELDSTFTTAWAWLARQHLLMYWFHYDRSPGRLAQARMAVDRALALDPGNPMTVAAQGYYAYYAELDYDGALRALSDALRMQPSNAEFIMGIAYVHRRQGRMLESLEYLEEALRLDPRNTRVVYNLGETQALLRRYAHASRSFQQAITLAPDWAEPHVFMARVALSDSGHLATARSILQVAPSPGGGSPHPIITRARIHVDVLDRRYADALHHATSSPADAFEEQFYFEPKALVIAELHAWANRPDSARFYYDSARRMLESRLATDPSDSRLHSALGIALAGLGRRQDAYQAGRRAVALLPLAKDAYRFAYRVADLALIHTMTGDLDSAIDELGPLLAAPSHLSLAELRTHPRWAPLQAHPRFKSLRERRW